MQTLDMAEGDEKKSLVHSQEGVAVVINDDNQKADILKKVFQVIHFGLAVGMFVVGLVEFCVEPTIFDIFGRSSERRAQIPEAVFKNKSISDQGLVHIMDAPIFFLFLTHLLSVLWLKCHGRLAWMLTFCHLASISVFVLVNAVFARLFLDWRYFYTRGPTILVDVVIMSFDWTFIIIILLHIRGWFPFKVNKKHMLVPYHDRPLTQRVIVALWNFVALFLVLCLCLLVWFSRLYMSWTCVKDKGEIRLMCQFTNLVQCWPCDSEHYCDQSNITSCIQDTTNEEAEVIRCIKPLYTVPPFKRAFCVFNYNIGPFTFVTVFAYVGGIYFFTRTVLNALVKCLYNIMFIAVYFCWNLVKHQVKNKKSFSPETTTLNDGDLPPPSGFSQSKTVSMTDPRVSLLGPLPYLKQNKHKD